MCLQHLLYYIPIMKVGFKRYEILSTGPLIIEGPHIMGFLKIILYIYEINNIK